MSTQNPKADAKRNNASVDGATSELTEEQLQDASGGMIFVKIPDLGDHSIKASSDGTPSRAEDRFNGKYFVQGATHSYTHKKP